MNLESLLSQPENTVMEEYVFLDEVFDEYVMERAAAQGKKPAKLALMLGDALFMPRKGGGVNPLAILDEDISYQRDGTEDSDEEAQRILQMGTERLSKIFNGNKNKRTRGKVSYRDIYGKRTKGSLEEAIIHRLWFFAYHNRNFLNRFGRNARVIGL